MLRIYQVVSRRLTPKPSPVLGAYEVTALLGEGGQGSVFAARGPNGARVAVKRIDLRAMKSVDELLLLEREREVLQSVEHPAMPRYLDHFEEDGAYFLVMELVEGDSLAALRARGVRFSEAEARSLIEQIGGLLGLVGLGLGLVATQCGKPDRTPMVHARPTTAPTPEPDEKKPFTPLERTCAAWLDAAQRGEWSGDGDFLIGDRAALAERIARRKLFATDLTFAPDAMPCPKDTGSFDAFVAAARVSDGAWSTATAVNPSLLKVLRHPDVGLAPSVRKNLQQRVESTAKAAKTAEELAVAQQLCGLEHNLELPASPACAPMAARSKALLAAQTAHEKACGAARQRFEDCRTSCVFAYDLFDPRANDCEDVCAKKHDVTGCD